MCPPLSFKQALMWSGIVQYKLSSVSGFIFDQAVLTFSMRDFFEVASGNLLTASWTMAHRFLIGSRLFPGYVPLSQKKAKLEPHHSWVLFAVWAKALSCWKICSDNFLLKTFKFFFMYLWMVVWDAGWPAAGIFKWAFWLSDFSPKFLAMTILAVLERIDWQSPPDLLSMNSTFLFWCHQFWMVLIGMCSAWYSSFCVEPPSSMHFNPFSAKIQKVVRFFWNFIFIA